MRGWLLLGLVAAACGGVASQETGSPSASGPGAAPGAPCTSAGECASGVCLFAVSDACAAHGSCYQAPTPLPARPSNCVNIPVVEACACDGSRATVAQDPANECGAPYPNGYAPTPIAHLGACEAPPQESADGSVSDGAVNPEAGICPAVANGGALNGSACTGEGAQCETAPYCVICGAGLWWNTIAGCSCTSGKWSCGEAGGCTSQSPGTYTDSKCTQRARCTTCRTILLDAGRQ